MPSYVTNSCCGYGEIVGFSRPSASHSPQYLNRLLDDLNQAIRNNGNRVALSCILRESQLSGRDYFWAKHLASRGFKKVCVWVNSNSQNTLHFFIRNPTNGYAPQSSMDEWWKKNAEEYAEKGPLLRLDEEGHQDDTFRKRSEAAKRGWETRRARERMIVYNVDTDTIEEAEVPF